MKQLKILLLILLGAITMPFIVNAASELYRTLTITSTLSVGTDITTQNQGDMRFSEQTGNGSNYIGFQAPDAVTSNLVFKLPDGDGSTDELLKTDGSGNLDWVAPVAAPPPGSMMWYSGTSAPTGWLIGDGSEVSRTTFSDLFAVTSTAFGEGNGSTTFDLPDCRGRFIRGHDDGAARDPDAASRTVMNTGGNSGDNVGSVQGHAVQQHNHGYNDLANGGSLNGGSGSQGSAQSTGNFGGNETRPINFYMTCIIKI